MKSLFFFLLFTVASSTICASTLKVPQNHNSIQAAIELATNGDTILVDTGIYYENINFRGKSVVVTSYYLIRDEYQQIFKTVIDGSKPINDTACVVIFRNGENENAVLEGFTLQGGKASVGVGNNNQFPEGGGIHIFDASPEIKFNFITNNSATNSSSGGAGISVSQSNSHIHNNIFYKNIGFWAGAFVANNSSMKFSNNLVTGNTGKAGWGGICLFYRDSSLGGKDTCIVENNTIVGNINHSALSIGVLQSALAMVMLAKNNIVYGNASIPNQITTRGEGIIHADFNNFPIDEPAENNISVYPDFLEGSFRLASTSPCIDGGDSASVYWDLEEFGNSGFAKSPSQGKIRNDIGYFGGPSARPFELTSESQIFSFQQAVSLADSMGRTVEAEIDLYNIGQSSLWIDSLVLQPGLGLSAEIQNREIPALSNSKLRLEWQIGASNINDTLLVFHSAETDLNPLKISISGIVKKEQDPASVYIPEQSEIQIYPQPAGTFINIDFDQVVSGHVSLFDLKGAMKITTRIERRENIYLDIAALSPGIYILQFQNDHLVISRKIIIT